MKNKKPEIRFKGFSEEWEERKLGDITNCYSGGTPSVGNREFYGGNIPFIRSGEINVASTELFINENGLQNSSAKFVEKGDILYALYGATSGEVGISRMNGAINQAILAIKPIKGFNNNFVVQWLRKEKTSIVDTYIQGGQGNLSGSIVKDLEIQIPSSNEQTQIGYFFKNLDNLITLHQRKYEKLGILKKAMLEKMFPKNGKNIPEIRFKGFEGAWEGMKLGEVADSVGYGLNAAAVDYDGVNRYIRITDIDEKSHDFNTDSLTSPNTNLVLADNYKLKEGDILFARTGASVGKSYYYKETDGLVYFAGFLIRVRLKPEFDTVFIFQNTLTNKYDNFIKLTSQRSGQPGVNAQEYSNYKIMIPEFEEQEKK